MHGTVFVLVSATAIGTARRVHSFAKPFSSRLDIESSQLDSEDVAPHIRPLEERLMVETDGQQSQSRLFESLSQLVIPRGAEAAFLLRPAWPRARSALKMSDVDDLEEDLRIAKMKAEAARLRAEAAQLEAAQEERRLERLEGTFEKFDLDGNGEISLSELKIGLSAYFKEEVSSGIAEKIMAEFDVSGDGALQLDEFQDLEVFQDKLKSIQRKEKDKAMALAKEARLEKRKAENEAAKAKLVSELVNDKPPKISDRLVSMLPYIWPTLDALQYAGPLLPDKAPTTVGLIALLKLYSTVPLGGLIAWIVLSVLSQNVGLNRLIRFNMRQAIALDIALLIPGLLVALVSPFAASVPEQILVAGDVLVILPYFSVVIYSVVSSALGIIPDKVPFISGRISMLIPSGEMLNDLLELGDDGNLKVKDADEVKDDDDDDDDPPLIGPQSSR